MLINKTVSYENIYCNLFYEVNKTKLFPKNYFKQKNILYEYEKNNGSKKFILVKIEDTIHYKYLINRDANMQIYKNYVELTNQPDHSIEKFDNLIGSFSEKKLLISKIKLEKINYK